VAPCLRSRYVQAAGTDREHGVLLLIACCAAAFKLQRQPAKTSATACDAMLVPLLASSRHLGAYSRTRSGLAVGVVLCGSMLFVIVRHRER
jgi:hypothetical protein